MLIALLYIAVVCTMWSEIAVGQEEGEKKSAGEWFLDGHQALSANNYDKALECYRIAVTLDPSFANAYLFLGKMYMKKAMEDEAFTAYKRALSLRPDDAIVHLHLGEAYLSKGLVDAAVSEFRKTVAIDA